MRQIARSPVRFFSQVASGTKIKGIPRVQFIHVTQLQGERGLRPSENNRKVFAKRLTTLDIRHQNTEDKELMSIQSDKALSTMLHLVKWGENHRGSFEKEHKLPIVNGDTIVNLTTSEFFFYPEQGLFSKALLERKLDILRTELKNFPNWLHFHFGTLPVLVVDNQQPAFMNIAIYGQGGIEPKVGYYTKKNHFPSDPYYNTFKGVSLNLPPYTWSETPNGQIFLKIYEICRDHCVGVAKMDMVELSELLFKAEAQGNLHGFHEITSNTTEVSIENALMSILSIADPGHNKAYQNIEAKEIPTWHGLTQIVVEKIPFFDLEKLGKPKQYGDMAYYTRIYKTVDLHGLSKQYNEELQKKYSNSSFALGLR
ncbi:MAG: hypothetical protein JSR33_12810 [Proteobacteria bacterium]|nr:hypothetical protein [Pseudomonadota bacterium]